MAKQELRDLVYFDFDKAASIFSQMVQGLPRERQTQKGSDSDANAQLSLDLRIASAKVAGGKGASESVTVNLGLHHDLLTRLEELLTEKSYLVTLGHDGEFSEFGTLRNIGFPNYLRAEGLVRFQDWYRLIGQIDTLDELVRFVNRCAYGESDVAQFQSLCVKLDRFQQELKSASGKQKVRVNADINETQRQLDAFEQGHLKVESPPKWLQRGLQLMLRTFIPDGIIARLWPVDNEPEFQVVANLKRECFLDEDPANVMFAYGSIPNVKLTMLGLVTSIPPAPGSEDIDAKVNRQKLSPRRGLKPGNDLAQLEPALQGVMDAMENIGTWARFSQYPRITVYPIALYRSILPVAS